MRVAEIYDEAKEAARNCDQATVFELISDAVEILANKGAWDARKAYLSLPVQSDNLVTLPAFVEVPMKVNVDNSPSFSRDRIYEFSLNGPGSTTARTDFSWEDRGFVPTLVTLTSASRLLATLSAADAVKKVVIRGLDASNNEITETLTLGVADVATTQTFSSITEVSKDATTNAISLYATANGTAHTTLLSTYQPYETEPRYRQIRLSKTGVTARMLVLRKSAKVRTMDDFIPVQSRPGLMLMIKAMLNYRRGSSESLTLATQYEEQATRLATEAQKCSTTFIDLAKDTESDSVRNLNINNRDSIIVSDIFDDVAAIVGPIGTQNVFDKITEGLEALNNKGHWDGLTGYVDIITDGNSYVTLPRYVESPIAINLGGRPMFMRNKWFEFHLNGPGSDCADYCKAWDWVGDVCTQHPLQYSVQLVAIPDSNSDDAKTVRIYGLDESGKWIRSGGSDGFTVIVDHTKIIPLTGDQKVSRIDRITRDTTAGFVRLTGYSTDQTQSIQLGYWYPDETEPQYMRIKLPRTSNWVRMRYRKNALKVTSLTDSLHLKNRTSIVTMIRSLKALADGQMDAANALEQKAVQFLEEEQSSRNPGETFHLQVGPGWDSNMILV